MFFCSVAELLREANFAFSPNKALRNFEQRRKKSNKQSTKKMIATGEKLLKVLTRQAKRKQEETERKIIENLTATLDNKLSLSSQENVNTISNQTLQ